MKKIIVIIFLFISYGVVAQDFYYYKDQKIQLNYNNQAMYIVTDLNTPEALGKVLGPDVTIKKFLIENGAVSLKRNENVEARYHYQAEVHFNNSLSLAQYEKKMADYKKSANILHVSRFYKNKNSDKIGLSNYLMVRLKKLDDYSILEQQANNLGLIIEGQNKFLKLWYTLSCNKNSTYDALKSANHLYETGLFGVVEPDLMTDDAGECVNDALFTTQWGHNNTGQNSGTSGIDINACNAWNTTKGSNTIVIAVLDDGFERNHPDLAANNFTTGFDSESGTTPSQVLGSHGTACAGIVAAVDDNNIGVAGVAPNCRIMSVSNSLSGSANSRQKRADGIMWAYQNGADVISNSWSSGVQYTVIDDAIDSAFTYGRGGQGMVVAFSAGNGNGAVSYPANSDPRILCVGAMSMCGERKNPSSCDGENWGSDFGSQLDIMAPGVIIQTTDRQGSAGYNSGNYAPTFNGTSAACPHVAGVAGLILSVNPCLSHAEVTRIIEQSAQKVGGYTYTTTSGRPNGTWDNEMGYGLLDAERAVQIAQTKYYQNASVTQIFFPSTINYPRVEFGFDVIPYSPSPNGNYTVNPSNLLRTVKAGVIILEPGTDINGSMDLDAQTGNCDTW
jgi:subtilisin family serine protease